MTSSWPVGVTTRKDMVSYAKALFGNCEIEDLLKDVPFYSIPPECFLFRVKGACDEANWSKWPNLIDNAMKASVETYGKEKKISYKSSPELTVK